ncbi:MAG: M20 family metallopeptidase [Dehalococcoidia bacterium]
MENTELKNAVIKEIDSRSVELENLSRQIHDNPETALEENRAAEWLSGYLEDNGFSLERGICDLPTAFKARYGRDRPAVGVLAEYDALPKIGHGCGHNLIAAAAIAAGTSARTVIDGLGGTVMVIGTPGEELAGGKAIMADRGAFDDVDAAMIVHPGGGNTVVMNTLACQTLEVEFIGKAAHASAEPEQGINALEAMILSYNAVNSLRQHIKDKARIHGVITDGGEAANIVPAHTAASFFVRAEDDEYLEIVKERVIDCFTGASVATGAELKYKWDDVSYAAMNNNLTMARLFHKNIRELGHEMPLGDDSPWGGSTDVGNVSWLIPTIHPLVSITEEDVLIHTPEFARIAGSEAGFRSIMIAAKAMAMTLVDLLSAPDVLKRAREEFEQSRSKP